MLLRKYHRYDSGRRKGHLRGLVMVDYTPGETVVKMGHSLCRKEDVFTKAEASKWALERLSGQMPGGATFNLNDPASAVEAVKALPQTLKSDGRFMIQSLYRRFIEANLK